MTHDTGKKRDVKEKVQVENEARFIICLTGLLLMC